MSFLEKVKNLSKKAKVISLISVVVLIGGGILIHNKMINTNNISNGESPVFEETYVIPSNEKIFINGTIIPTESKDFSPSSEGELSKINVSNGQIVQKGDLLFTCKNSSALDEIESLNVQVSELKKQKIDLTKDPENLPDQSIDVEIGKINAQIISLNKKAYVNTYAPFSGKVYLNQQKDNAEQPSSLMTLQSTEFYMRGQASEQDLAKMKVDQGVEILVFSTDQKLKGHVSFISDRPTTQPNDMNAQSSLSYYDVDITFDTQENLVNGFHVQASIEVDSSTNKIPLSCIKIDGNQSYVFKCIDGMLNKQTIEIENKSDEFAVVKSGLKENDIILRYPSDDTKDGDPVSIDDALINKESEGN